jgi:hypothetical protein
MQRCGYSAFPRIELADVQQLKHGSLAKLAR